MPRFLLLVLPLFLMSCASRHEGLTKVVLSSTGGDDIVLWVEVADDPAEQARGLMERTELPEDQGMLFIFEESQPLSFWMKNTKMPLDVLFFDSDGTFVSAQAMNPCQRDPCATYPSQGRAKYALEVNAGFASTHGVGEGWTMRVVGE